jgi:O-acetyl-ADP-ribose deacetylase (regulator of RNase III)
LTKFEVVVGDIVEQVADAIVNAANSQLERGGGVCGAIYRAAGPGLADEVKRRYPNGCTTGESVETAAYELRARHIIHAVGPRCIRADDYERNLLASAYYSAVKVASETGCRSIVFPSFGTGIYGWDISVATVIAHSAVLSALMEFSEIERITFCCFSDEDAEVFRKVFSAELE